ncbi:MAG: PH domain-containing protein [Oscillospiraceae bacterium]|nr:PH domain-containing protein [Oscillospiraceae bacterium]
MSVFNFALSLLLLVLFGLCGVYAVFFWAKQKSNSLKYYFEEDYFKISKGVYFKKEIELKLSKVLYVDTTSAPDQKLFGVCSTVFYLAGTKVRLEHISLEDSKDIIKEFKARLSSTI